LISLVISPHISNSLSHTNAALSLGTFYNSIPGQDRKDTVEEWAKERYPAIWKELKKLGQTEHEEGHMLFNIEQKYKA
jgi:hypothetical protein